MYRCVRELTHRPTRDGCTVSHSHVPAFLAVEVAGYAWNDALIEVSGGELTAAGVAIVNLEGSFSRELLVGEAEFQVSLLKIGRTSFTLKTSIGQNGTIAAVFTFTLASVRDGAAAPLSDGYKKFLQVLEA